MTTRYVTEVQSSVKKGVHSELSRLTLLLGPNGAGKTSIINSIELALGGFASDVMGKAISKKPADLIVLSNDGKTLESTATLSDGERANWNTSATPSGAKRPSKKGPKAIFPFQEVKDHLTASPAKARIWLLKQFRDAAENREEILSRFPEGLRADYERYAAVSTSDGTEIDLLLHIISQLGDSVRAKRSEAKTLEKILGDATQRLGPEPSTAHISLLKAKEEHAFAEFSEWREQAASIPDAKSVEQLRLQAVKAAKDLIHAEEQFQECSVVVHAYPPVTPELEAVVELRSKVIQMADLHIQYGLHSCLVCESNGSPDFRKRSNDLARANTSRKESLDAYRKKQEWEEAVKYGREYAQEAVKKWQESQAAHGPTGNTILLETQEKRNAYQLANDHRVDAERLRDQWNDARSIQDRFNEALEASESAKKLEKGCQAVVKSILQSATQAFEERVQAFLPKGDVFGLEIHPNSDTCRFGLRHADGTLHSALSGAEWARVMMAISCAITSESGDIVIFAPEERAFDPKTLGAVMRSLENAPGQVILSSPIAPRKGAYLDKWKVVSLK